MTEKKKGTQWVHICLLLLALLRVAVRPQMYRCESRVLYELIFVAFDCFRILMHDHLLILTHIIVTLHRPIPNMAAAN